ncbi:TPA: hypothetical protein HA251_05440 [Candidatus Woesearchaeota archaeon]|nr:hypothetical protein [Candidatus Woesearchaeota archaeon]
MNAKTIMLWSLPILFLTGSVALAAGYHSGGANVQGANYNAQAHEQLESAIEARDYDAWLKVRQEYNLPMRGKIFQVINKDNFGLYADLHAANEAGDLERAAAIRTELGVGTGRGSGQGGRMQGAGQHSCNQAGHSGMQSGMYRSGSCGMHPRGAGYTGPGFVDVNGDGLCDRLK